VAPRASSVWTTDLGGSKKCALEFVGFLLSQRQRTRRKSIHKEDLRNLRRVRMLRRNTTVLESGILLIWWS